jgi:hypothetical protein
MPQLKLVLAIGGYAQAWHLGPACKPSLTATVAAWRSDRRSAAASVLAQQRLARPQSVVRARAAAGRARGDAAPPRCRRTRQGGNIDDAHGRDAEKRSS